ncbi:MAG: flagellar basal body-associated FliL family protein [Gammaproteobacteria bacterium]|nr:flagellar basal body-associated FliL family protein [Gammaproteobacteria bacterium]
MNKFFKITVLPLVFALVPIAGVPAADGEAPGAAPKYLKLSPSFTVNLATTERQRYMRVEAQIMSRDQGQLDAAKDHMPALRHELILLFSDQTPKAVKSVTGKERLRDEALRSINAVLEQELGRTPVEAVYFTSLVIQ